MEYWDEIFRTTHINIMRLLHPPTSGSQIRISNYQKKGLEKIQ